MGGAAEVNDGQELCWPPALRHDWILGLRYAGPNMFVHYRIVCRVCSASYITYPGSFTAEENEGEWRRIMAGLSPRCPVWNKLRF
jgi:hypothetical protein